MYEAIWQWKDHLLFCKLYVGIVVKPSRFREKAVRRHFRSIFRSMGKRSVLSNLAIEPQCNASIANRVKFHLLYYLCMMLA